MPFSISLSDAVAAPLNQSHDSTLEILPDVSYKRLVLVNVVFIGHPDCGDREWVLVDTGIKGSAASIKRSARERFGERSRPACIVLTHGHFDHVGSVSDLSEDWDCPVFAHECEKPYLDGSLFYPHPDPKAGGGVMSGLSPLFSRSPIDLGERLKLLRADDSIPGLSEWQWIGTPGHSPGHISLFRDSDGVLVAGDAFTTTKQESIYSVALQKPELHGPPMYFTHNWERARLSIIKLYNLHPEIVITGHGPAMKGEVFREALKELLDRFEEICVPDHLRGRLHQR